MPLFFGKNAINENSFFLDKVKPIFFFQKHGFISEAIKVIFKVGKSVQNQETKWAPFLKKKILVVFSKLVFALGIQPKIEAQKKLKMIDNSKKIGMSRNLQKF